MKPSTLKLAATVSLLALAACGQSETTSSDTQNHNVSQAAASPELGSFGVDLSARNEAVDPGDDFFAYASGTWYDGYEIPADKTSFGAFNALRDRSDERVRAIIEDLTSQDLAQGSVEQKVSDYYASFVNNEARNAAGITPMQPLLDEIAAANTHADIAALFAKSGEENLNSPLGFAIGIDRKNPDKYNFNLSASGLGLPDRDYYLDDSERFQSIRAAYVDHIAEMLGFAGVEDAGAKAEAILAAETRVAEAHWPRADRRNRDKTYNPTPVAELGTLYPGVDFVRMLDIIGADIDTINVSHPTAIAPIIDVINDTPVETWKAYLTYHAISNHAPYLSEAIDDANFAFYGKVLRGQPEQRARWQRGVAVVGNRQGLGEALGQIYVDRYFPESAKAQMEDLVENLRKALGERIDDLDWMGEDTKEQAQAKLAAFRPKIAYPDKWKDLSAIEIVPGDLYGNYKRVSAFFYEDGIDRLSRPTDKDEWFMTPQTVNAYYNPQFNEIVFPAAILQPPFFDPSADPAVNYGGIGAVIGHEMGHGFDDQGSKSDAGGVQRNWWTDEDRANFEARANMLVEQYNGYEAVEGNFVDGSFTLGENIGDVGGLAMAYHAYKLSLDGKEAPVIDGLTGDQRFFLAWAQVWKSKSREEATLQRLKSDPHSPNIFRVNGVVRNHDAWYEAFNVTEDDALYLPPEERVRIW